MRITFDIHITGQINIDLPSQAKPHKPKVLSVKFHKKGKFMIGTVALSPLVGSDHVSSRQVVVTLNGTDLQPIEAIDTPAQFTCSDGDTGSIVCTDINAAGSTASEPFPFTASLPLQPPAAPSVVGVTFSGDSATPAARRAR